MEDFDIQIVRSPVSRATIAELAARGFGTMVKAVADIDRGVLAIGGELHSDEEAVLLEDGSQQRSLWGINLHIDRGDDWVEFDSMINVRPSQGNLSRGVDDLLTQSRIRDVVVALVTS